MTASTKPNNEKSTKEVEFNGISCLYSNVDQLLNKMDDLCMLIANNKPDIMLFTEVVPKAQRNPIEEIQIKLDGYEHYTNFNFTDRDLGKSGMRGVAIYVKDNMLSKKVQLENEYEDQIWVEISLRNKDSLLCGCMYRSPTRDKEQTVQNTASICKSIFEVVGRKNSHLLICGDFNYPDIEWNSEYVSSESNDILPFLDAIQDCHLHQHIFKPTRYRDGNEPSLLDLIFTNEEGMLQTLQHNAGLGNSDHECIEFTLNCYKDTVCMDIQEKLNFFKADYTRIRNIIKNIDWKNELRGDFLTSYSRFTSQLEFGMKGLVPFYGKIKSKTNIYLTLDAIRIKDRKNKLWRRYKKTRHEYDYTCFKRTKNRLRTLTRNLRMQFESTIARDAKLAPKKFWSYVKSKTKTRSTIPPLLRKDGTQTTSASGKAEMLNEFFCSNFTDEDVDNVPINFTQAYDKEILDHFTIESEVVQKKLHDLNPGKTPGDDGWHPMFLKNISDLIVEPLTTLFNKSLDEGVVPTQWLKGCITAIHKKDEKQLWKL